MIVPQLFQHRGISAVTGLGAAGFLAIQSKSVKQQFPQLFGGGQVEVHAGGFFGVSFQTLQGGSHLRRQFLEIGNVNPDARGFHLRQDWFQGLLHLLEQRQHLRPHGSELVAEQQCKTSGHVHIHGAVLAG